MVRSHSRLPTHRPGELAWPYGQTPPIAALFAKSSAESRMLKFLGSTVGIIFLIGLVVVILLLKFIF
ncbi:MAG TPA: hypothetical protein VGO61_16840 [Steroidobacteraceae bacterium]|nr:hypothetical protein [Steroidobacteraceae bacterium]